MPLRPEPGEAELPARHPVHQSPTMGTRMEARAGRNSGPERTEIEIRVLGLPGQEAEGFGMAGRPAGVH